jgi:hypothetical protein
MIEAGSFVGAFHIIYKDVFVDWLQSIEIPVGGSGKSVEAIVKMSEESEDPKSFTAK